MNRLAILLASAGLALVAATSAHAQTATTRTAMNATTTEQTKQAAVGDWISIAPEIRPSAVKNADGSLKPFYLSRQFTYSADNKFTLSIVNFADAGGKVPLSRMTLKGSVVWQGDHPIAAGAQSVQFTADEAFDVTPLHAGFVAAMNQVPGGELPPWQLNVVQSLKGKGFAPFGLRKGEDFTEFDLMYVAHGMLFWGARNVDGRGFDTAANRPTNLQIPMLRK